MDNLKNTTDTLNAHLLNYHKDKAEIWNTIKLQDNLNKQLVKLVEDLGNRVVILEEVRKIQIKINTKLLKEPAPVKQNWLDKIFNR